MILRSDDIRRVRPVAENLNDISRLEPYIKEAENLRHPTSEEELPPYHGTEVDRSDILAVFYGGYYQGCGCAEIQHNPGLIPAIAYIAYSRFLGNNQINATAFGVVTKLGEFSSPSSDMSVVRAQNEARMVGEAYLKKSIEHLESLGLMCGCQQKYHRVPKRAYVMGDRRKS